MKTRDGSERIQVLNPKSERVTLVPEQMIAVIGCALMARPLFEHWLFEQVYHGGEVIWCGALVGALVVAIAFTTMDRLTGWQPWAQAAVGYGLCFASLVLSSDTPDWITLAAGPAIMALAVFEIDAIESRDDHARHRGWRQPATRPGRGLRLVHSSALPRCSENGGSTPDGPKPAA